jgi:IS1 family transposase
MANILKLEKQVAAISMLAEGSSVRSTERVTGIHRDTIIRLMQRVGESCADFSDKTLRDLNCKRIEVDEIWGFVGKKNKNIDAGDNPSEVGDQYTFVALDAESKLIPSYLVGKRTAETTVAFIDDLASRLHNRIQLSSDGFSPYVNAIKDQFGHKVDYAQIVKEYSQDPADQGRYSPPRVRKVLKDDIIGFPNMDLVSTSFVECSNLNIRMHCRRLTRLTNAFSKRLDNFKRAMDLYFCYYNFVLFHRTIRMTPAMQAGVVSSPMTVKDLVEMAQ